MPAQAGIHEFAVLRPENLWMAAFAAMSADETGTIFADTRPLRRP